MAGCDLCGREVELVRVEIEGTELAVCGKCGKFGKILRGRASGTTNVVLGKVKSEEEIRNVLVSRQMVVKEEIEEGIVADFAGKIRGAREKRGMRQKDFAKLLNEKESLVQKWEGGSLVPRLSVARKLEKVLEISLVEKVEEGEAELKGMEGKRGLSTDSGEMTLGDMIKVRKRKS